MSIPSKTVQNHLCASNFRVASAQLTFFAAQGAAGSIISEGTMNLFRGEIQKLTLLTKDKKCLLLGGPFHEHKREITVKLGFSTKM